ncbi:ribonuclease Z [Cohnella fermenti]|uniref:Ribonuclease Z n=1 Tax=Cohnella fermenti TaxID=2565925 RepID=A0A4V3WFA9_9BACL|nr:ribonuclease Z [Cohnella fermenti]THF79520.1 ribonuclease Z [Cohnella fermenti]
MKLILLGTGAGRPTLERNVTSIALQFPERRNRFWLFDAGEGTQHQLLGRKELKLSKLEAVFITHLHGDHLYGLPGLLTSRSFIEGAGKLTVYGPAGISAYLEGIFAASEVRLDYELEIVELEDERTELDAGFCRIVAMELDHRIRCLGYRIVESPRCGALDTEKLARLGLPPGPEYGLLKRGESVTLADGTTVRPGDVLADPTPGATVTILGDTAPCGNAFELGREADLLVHEATFAAGLEEKAAAYGHSTIAQACGIALKSEAKRLVVTHFSARYAKEDVRRMVEEARSIFPEVYAAHDGAEFDVRTGFINN